MTSRTAGRFWRLYEALPSEVRTDARKTFALFQADPAHPFLHFKELRHYPGFWSARVSYAYRAVCKRDGETAYWFWIGSHADFDRNFG